MTTTLASDPSFVISPDVRWGSAPSLSSGGLGPSALPFLTAFSISRRAPPKAGGPIRTELDPDINLGRADICVVLTLGQTETWAGCGERASSLSLHLFCLSLCFMKGNFKCAKLERRGERGLFSALTLPGPSPPPIPVSLVSKQTFGIFVHVFP